MRKRCIRVGLLFRKDKDKDQPGKDITLAKRVIYVTGLPRAGSTLLCQLLGIHPKVYSVGHSSPLQQVFENLRHQVSDNPFLLSQLDVDFDLTYRRLLNAYRGYLNGWFAETDLPWVVDKNRGWLGMMETVKLIDPDFKMIVCLRDPVQILGSIEAQHRKTILLDFPDHLAPNQVYPRADLLFKNEGVIGGPLKAIENLQDIMDEEAKQHIFYLSFEALVAKPQEVMSALFSWLGLPAYTIDPENLPVKPHESDSYYRFKYRHKTHAKIRPPQKHIISERIIRDIIKNYAWFYKTYYPDHYPELLGK
jgi:sulfotransferase